ncbi:MAG: hypothetical protein LC663_05800, partial [Actinobacteria bacterium]|nr:hypothetical protein [Actinomycetota bacterium]
MKRTSAVAALLALVVPFGAHATTPAPLDALRASCARGTCDMTSLGTTLAGAHGPEGWLRAAARLKGIDVAAPTVARTDLRRALRAFYGSIGYRIDAGLANKIDATSSLPRAQAATVASLVSAVTTAIELSHAATKNVTLPHDIKRAFELTTLSSSPSLMTPARRAEFASLQRELGAVDMATMVRAGLVMTEAINAAETGPLPDQLDLPYVTIGNDGNTTYTKDEIISIDRSGDDTYRNNAGGAVEGIGGSALAIDEGDGSDTYDAAASAQGYGEGGVGILDDQGGSDSYSNGEFGQGAAVAGIGLLYDEG